MAVVGDERGTGSTGLEQLVPVHRREAAPHLELAARVEDLDSRDGRGQLEAGRSRTRPVGVREIRDSTRRDDPFAGRREVAALTLELGRVAPDPDPEHVPVSVVGQRAVELDSREHHERRARRCDAAVPVIGERDDVVAGTSVVPRDGARRELAVRVRAVGVKRRPEPFTIRSPGRVHAGDPIAGPPMNRVRSRDTAHDKEGPWRISRSRSTSSFDGWRRIGSTVASCSSGVSRPRPASPSCRCPKRPSLRVRRRSRTRRFGERRRTSPQIVAAAKKEGHLNVIALPPDWANYGEIISTFTKKYGIGITSDNPNGSSSDGESGDRLPQGRPPRTRRRRRQRRRSRSRAPSRTCTAGTTSRTTRPCRGR